MRKKVISLLVLIFLLFFYVQVGSASGISVYAGVNQTTSSTSQLISLEVNNYSIYVNAEGVIADWIYDYSSFIISKGKTTFFTISIDGNVNLISIIVERRLIINEPGEYNFSFLLKGGIGDYMNYEVILTEMAIIFQTKTSIIAEAPYGMSFILLAIICFAIIQKRRKSKLEKF